MGLEIAELMMDLEEHLEIHLDDSRYQSASPVIDDVSIAIHKALLENGINRYSQDYIAGVIIGLIFARENKKTRAGLCRKTNLVKDLNYG